MSKTEIPETLEWPDCLVISFGNLKGGPGKTTAAFFLATFFGGELGKKTLLIDADPLSQTAYSWYRKLKKLEDTTVPFDLIPFPSPQLGNCIADYAPKYDVILVDVGGESDAIFKAAVTESDILVMLATAQPADVNRIASTFAAAEEAAARADKTIDVYVLMTKIKEFKRDGKNVSKEYWGQRRKLEDADFTVLDRYASDWKWYRQATDGDLDGGVANPLDSVGEFKDIGFEILTRFADFQREMAEEATA
jgi:chromosome partitioning protein